MTEQINENTEIQNADAQSKNEITKKKRYIDKHKYYNGDYATKLAETNYAISRLQEGDKWQQIMLPYGYNREKVAALTVLYEEVSEMLRVQSLFKVDKTGANRNFTIKFKEAQREAAYLVKLIRLVFRDDLKKLETLRLSSRRGRSIADYFAFMSSLAAQILADEEMIAGLSACSCTRLKVEAFRVMVTEAKNLYDAYNRACADATAHTRDFRRKLAELDVWMSEFNGFLKLALEQNGMVR